MGFYDSDHYEYSHNNEQNNHLLLQLFYLKIHLTKIDSNLQELFQVDYNEQHQVYLKEFLL